MIIKDTQFAIPLSTYSYTVVNVLTNASNLATNKGYFSKLVIKSNLSQVDYKSIQQSINFNLSLVLYNSSIM